nr:glycosyl hydrolase [Micromonospora sp. DSM 115978]
MRVGTRDGSAWRRASVRLAFVGGLSATFGLVVVQPVPAVAAPQLVAVVEDTDIGPELNQVTYTSDWVQCGGCDVPTPNDSYRFSNTDSAVAVIRFAGTHVKLHGVMEGTGGRAMVVIDDFPATVVDMKAESPTAAVFFESTVLADTDHILYLFNLGQTPGEPSADVVTFDRAEIFRDPDVLPRGDGPRSRQPWLSGVNGDPGTTAADVDAFCAWRGSACDLAHVFVGRDSWAAVTEPSFAQQNFAGWPGRLVMSVPPFPENVGASLETCATGAYDEYWQTFGHTLNITGRQDSVVRIAWQANGNWFEWSGSNPQAYVECWRRVADAINATADPDPLLEWSINGGYSHNPPTGNPTELYPGDEWVDLIGIDYFDQYPPTTSRAQFDATAAEVGGITWLYNFARAHDKPFGVGQWGVVNAAAGGGAGGGGDNALYVQLVREWMLARAGEGMFYESYFTNCDAGGLGSNLARAVTGHCVVVNPAAADAYRTHWTTA